MKCEEPDEQLCVSATSFILADRATGWLYSHPHYAIAEAPVAQGGLHKHYCFPTCTALSLLLP